MLVTVIAFVAFVCVKESIYEKEHPCMRYGTKQTCYMNGYFITGAKGMLIYVPGYYYDCTPCIERK